MANETDLADEIRCVKMLMILQLIRDGVTQSQIAAALGVSEATMSRMLPKGVAKGVSKGKGAQKVEGTI